MRNILHLFRCDLARIRRSVIALIVVVGLIIVPVLYAWFNIAGSWDPYGNTGNLKVAVANTDRGYRSDLIPIKVNIGNSVTSALRENKDLDWVFVDRDQAVEGVRSGEYYAAVVIPEDFSSDMMTLFSTQVKHSNIIYYENQKANAIAPRVTDKGATTVRKQIDETFTETIGSIGLSTSANLLDFMNSDQIGAYVSNLNSTLDASISGLRDAHAGTKSLSGLLGSTSGLVGSTGRLMGDTGGTSAQMRKLLADAKQGLGDTQASIEGAADTINHALGDTAASYDAVSSAVGKAFSAAGTQAGDTQSQLKSIASRVGEQAARTEKIKGDIEKIERDLPDLDPRVKAPLDGVISRLDAVAKKQRDLEARLNAAASDIGGSASAIEQNRKDIQALVAEAKAGITQVKADYETTLKQNAAQLEKTVEDTVSGSRDTARDLDATVKKLSSSSESLASELAGAQGVLGGVTDTLDSSAEWLAKLKGELEGATNSHDLVKIRSIIGEDPAALASALAAPVGLSRHAVYPIANYGSAMAPFYTVLSMWVGNIVLAAMLKVVVDTDLVKRLMPVRLHELYLGRFLLFATLALCQSTLVCAGDILFFGIQCDSPLAFIATGWLAGFVFCNIIYALTVSFGDVGKALAVVLLVMQVAGSGGTFPIQMTADFFQAVYPWLPFTHAINAMHAAMAGSYGAEYLAEMSKLAIYLLPSLALGLLLRRPIIRANTWVIEKIESTKLM
ncbi:YhgE/Pip N-terminal domain protein [Coriobacterium glomerans PW2]|uniref:YhgE/Pip N-terminal domain protein n=1 Tax=Coriobacterium glomerans (strain ATCC 49209 / DSM 20642 / JCM 10262 / PW2) TaxID=700015 RepID=F2NB08_CORGP|nr:YhgE/Pip domain-containing protein [Coriobacterium glomerans]AEB07686.1 YhgE/Pip N-terminal domain protein [Coriobacterium glomerans PW2]